MRPAAPTTAISNSPMGDLTTGIRSWCFSTGRMNDAYQIRSSIAVPEVGATGEQTPVWLRTYRQGLTRLVDMV